MPAWLKCVLLALVLCLASLAAQAVDAFKTATASHILVDKEETALKLKERIAAGEDFATLAREHSSCPSKSKGGSLGSFKEGMMVKPFNDAVANAKIGDVEGPVKTQFGWHLILVTARE